MPLSIDAFQETEPGLFKAELLTADGYDFPAFINTAGEPLSDEAVSFVRDYHAGESQTRQQAASKVFAEHEELSSELGYATAEDLCKALRPCALTVFWQRREIRMPYVSPQDDLKLSWGTHVILVCYDGETGEWDMNLEQDEDC